MNIITIPPLIILHFNLHTLIHPERRDGAKLKCPITLKARLSTAAYQNASKRALTPHTGAKFTTSHHQPTIHFAKAFIFHRAREIRRYQIDISRTKD